MQRMVSNHPSYSCKAYYVTIKFCNCEACHNLTFISFRVYLYEYDHLQNFITLLLAMTPFVLQSKSNSQTQIQNSCFLDEFSHVLVSEFQLRTSMRN